MRRFHLTKRRGMSFEAQLFQRAVNRDRALRSHVFCLTFDRDAKEAALGTDTFERAVLLMQGRNA